MEISSRMSHIEEIRNKIHLDLHTVRNTEDTRYPGTYSGYDDTWNFTKFKNNFKMDVVPLGAREVEIDMIGIDTPFANAFRRILLAEVRTILVRIFILNLQDVGKVKIYISYRRIKVCSDVTRCRRWQ